MSPVELLSGKLHLDSTADLAPTLLGFNFGLGVGFDFWKVQSVLDFVYTLENITPDDATTLGWSVKF